MKFSAYLTETGLAVDDTATVCAEFVKVGDWDQVKRRAIQENLLGKGSEARIKKLLRNIQRRLFAAPAPLARPKDFARFLASPVQDAAKCQLLFALATRTDAALSEAYQRLIVPAITGSSRNVPSTDALCRFLDEVAQIRADVAKWTSETKSRWSQGFRLVLREAGFVTGLASDRETLSRLVLRDETICLLCHCVAESGVSGWAILQHDVLRLLLLSDADAVRAARGLRERGWWTYAQSGDIVEFRPTHASLNEWMSHVLGS